MATKKIYLQEEQILKLVLQFLSSRKYYKSARSLEKETGVNTNPYSENINFFRDLVLDGDWAAVREFGEPLADIPAFEYLRFNFLVTKQEYLEILFEKCEGNSIKDEQVLRDRLLVCLKNLERYCKFKEEYNKLYWYLSVPSLRTEPEFCDWSIDYSRMQLFEEMLVLLKQFIPVEEQNFANNTLGSDDRLTTLLFKGSLYENCIELCQKQAMGKTTLSDVSSADIKIDFFRKQSLKSAGNFYSWLHSLSKESFVEAFEELNFDLCFQKFRQNRDRVDVKNNSLSRSLTIEMKSPGKVFSQRGKDERRKRFSDLSSSKQTILDFDVRDVSQSFAEFEILDKTNDRSGISNTTQRLTSNKNHEVFLRNGEIYPDVPGGNALNVSSSKGAQSPRKARRDQQSSVLQQLEEHKQRQRELYDQLAESASLAKENGRIKDSKNTEAFPDESAATRGLDAVKKSIQNLRLLTENFESPKVPQTAQTDLKDEVFRLSEINDHKQRDKMNQEGVLTLEGTCPDTNSLPNEMLRKKSSSSTPGSAGAPKTPVNTCLPPGLVKLTDGSGAFNTSTPKAGRQTFTTPLPASPVTTEQIFSRHDVPLRQSQQPKKNPLEDESTPPDANSEQTPKISGVKPFAVRRSLENTVFQTENNEGVGPKPFANANDAEDSRLQAISTNRVTDQHISRHSSATVENDPKYSKYQNYSASNSRHSAMKDPHFPRPAHTDVNEPRFQNISRITPGNNSSQSSVVVESIPHNSRYQNHSTPNSAMTNARSPRQIQPDTKHSRSQDTSIYSKPCKTFTIENREELLQESSNVPLHFHKSAKLADTQAIRAVAFHPNGKYFAVGTNSKALKICCKNVSPSYFDGNEQDTPDLEVVCQKTSIHKGSVYCVAFSSNGDIIATGSNDKTVKLLRFDEDNPVSLEDQMDLVVHKGTIRDLTFVNTAAGSHPVLASGGAGGGLIYLSDCYTGQTYSSLQGHSGNIMAVFASNQAHLLCSGSADKTVRLWDLRVAKCIDMIATSSCVTSVCLSDGTTKSLLLASADENGQCIVYDVGARKSIIAFNPHEMDCRSIRFSPDSRHILTGSYDSCVSITAVEHNNSSKILSETFVVGRHIDKVIQCRWHPSERSFLSTSADRTAVLWEQTTR
ncbi:WD repeat-containing protein 47-like [Dendronephthya gigantea]|uniref:WD repeat-containing protein 47-like n=1 Tax=Dendronephthya gigantea TaxID=151771 RepID=UPI0010698AEA|nr:WD repeat-containing protein 47-like [Dendronephthya gigantea]